MIDCCVSTSQTLTNCFALANSYHCLRVFCLFIKAGWPRVASNLFCQPFNVPEVYIWKLLAAIHSGMKLAYYTLLISLCRQMCQKTIVNQEQCSWFWEKLDSALCRWKLLRRGEGQVSPSQSVTEQTFWNLRKEMKPISCFLQSGPSVVLAF